MNWLNNIKMLYKFLLVAVIGIIFSILIGAYGMTALSRSNQQATGMYNNNTVAISELGDLRKVIVMNALSVAEHLHSNDPAAMTKLENDITNRAGEFNTVYSAYKKTNMSPAEAQLVPQFDADIVAYRDARVAALAASRKTISGLLQDELAATNLYNQMSPLRDNCINDINKLVDINRNDAQSVEASITASYASTARNFIIITIISVLLAFLISFYIAKSVVHMINVVKEIINKTASFDLVYDDSVAKLSVDKDELGDITRSIGEMRKKLRDLIASVQTKADVVLNKADETSQSTHETSISIMEVAKTVEQLAEGSTVQAQDAQRASEKLQHLGNEILQTVDSAISLKRMSDQTGQENDTEQKAIKNLEEKFKQNTQISAKVGQSVASLAGKSSSINQIIGVIESVAEQTNLLALNAAIEAARAGEAGRGFAVVSDEIRKLAEQTAASTREISAIVSDIQREINVASQNMTEAESVVSKATSALSDTSAASTAIGSVLTKMIGQVNDISKRIDKVDGDKDEVFSAIESISAVSQESAAATEEVSATVEQQTATIETIAHMANDMKAIAVELKEAVSMFKL